MTRKQISENKTNEAFKQQKCLASIHAKHYKKKKKYNENKLKVLHKKSHPPEGLKHESSQKLNMSIKDSMCIRIHNTNISDLT